jgi:thiamine-phosphate pyrophosphorylase
MIENLAEVLRLMLVTDDRLLGGRDLVDVCLAAERGGVTAIQVRLKQASPRQLADAVRRLLGHLSIPVLVNDRLDVALATGAAGVHLGPDDVPVAAARSLAPPGFLVGASVGSEAEVANGELADYWGVGPYRPTGTKSDAGEALGPEGLRKIIALAGGKPCVAIGGVVPPDMPAIRECGTAGVAVVSGLLGSADVESAARAYASVPGPGATAPPRAGARHTSG